MHKAIQLKVKLWIEGEDEPAHDFAASTIQAVQAILATSHRRYPKLTITIKQIVEDSDDEEDGDDVTTTELAQPAQPAQAPAPATTGATNATTEGIQRPLPAQGERS